MIFSRDDPDNLEIKVKYESWRYYDIFTAFHFIDGRFVRTDDVESVPGGCILPDYSPGLFEEGMNPGYGEFVVENERIEYPEVGF